MKPASSVPATTLAPVETLTVGLWRHGLIPMLGILRGKSAPRARIVERRYGHAPSETMDILAPKPGVAARSAVVFIHGGGWISGSKGRFYHRPLFDLADAGHPVFSLNYPLAPEFPHPTALRSILAGLAKLRREHNVEEVHQVGDSAGGNLAAMVGLFLANSEMLRRIVDIEPGALPRALSVVSLYGVLDRTSWLNDGFPSARLFLSAYAGRNAQDATWVPEIPVTPMDASAVEHVPPTLVAVGSEDKLRRSSLLYATHLQSRGADVTLKSYDGADHGFWCFAGPLGDALRTDVREFLAAVESKRGLLPSAAEVTP